MSRNRTEETKQAAVDLVRSGNPVKQVAKTYGVSASCIRIWAKRLGANGGGGYRANA